MDSMALTGPSPARLVLAQYPVVQSPPGSREPVLTPVSGGFSGADVWRIDINGEPWCLRRWPVAAPPLDRLHELHRWLHWLHSAGLPVAVPCTTSDGRRLVWCDGRCWHLEPWMPGLADFHANPSDERLQAILETLARLHLASAEYRCTAAGRDWFTVARQPSPAVTERLQRWAAFTPAEFARLSNILARQHAPGGALALEILQLARLQSRSLTESLTTVRSIDVPCLPCLRDIWHDHLLLSGSRVTGVIDATATRTETVAADLSRLLSSLLGDAPPRWERALSWYAAARPLSEAERRLIPVLDFSGVVLSGLYWVEQLASGPVEDSDGRIRNRMQRILERLRRFQDRAEHPFGVEAHRKA